MRRTLGLLGATALVSAFLPATTAAAAPPQSPPVYLYNNGDLKAYGVYHSENNQLCVTLVQGYRAAATIHRDGSALGTIVDFTPGGEACLDVPMNTENGQLYRLSVTWNSVTGVARTQNGQVYG